MLIYAAQKIVGEQNKLDAIREMQSASGHKKNKIFMDLYETFKGLLSVYYRKIESAASDRDEKTQLSNFIMREFWQALEKVDASRSIGEVINFIKTKLQAINKDTALSELGKVHQVKQIERYDVVFRNALKRYHKQYKKRPDLINDETDRENFAKIMGIKEEKIDEILNTIGQKNIKSINDEIFSDAEGNVETFLDTLESQEPLPDELIKNKEFMYMLMREIHKTLTPDERRVLIEYYNLNKPDAQEKTKDEIAQSLGMPFRQVKYHLDKANIKLKNSPVLKDLYTAAKITKTIKFALQHSPLLKFSNEQIIQEIFKEAKKEL